MGAYNVRTLTYKNQTQVRFFKKPIEFDKKRVRANERKKKTEEERTQFDIDLSIRQSMHRTKDKIWNICLANDWSTLLHLLLILKLLIVKIMTTAPLKCLNG